MCTALTLNNKKVHLFGRNMDIEMDHGWHVVITPRNYKISYRFQKEQKAGNAIIGMGLGAPNPKTKAMFPLYAEAANEHGLAIAGLNFPKVAFFPKPGSIKGAFELAPFELIPYVLANFKTVDEVKKFIEKKNLQLVDEPFVPVMPNQGLHYIIADKNDKSIVLEPCADGLKVYDNPLGVLTNNPTFDWQMTNLAFYQNLHQIQSNDVKWVEHTLAPFGQGFASYGLPGDWTPPSRFVKTAFLKSVTDQKENTIGLITQFFHILDNVAMVKGGIVVVMPDKSKHNDITLYTSCINLEDKIYYYKTYTNNQINAVDMKKEDLNATEIKLYPLANEQAINLINK